MTKLSDLGPPIKGTRHGGEQTNEVEHFYVCRTCGQSVDRRDLRQVIWHERPDHKPLEQDS
ncbi:hypothetical protein [Mesorhizobium sp. WSM4906]|uniref:hypothetical protein n=1 Tax=Mesorhizobium sp. WSM4906 TaxID=3038546 RepID=UPI002415FC8B|nr:hypothetical protein [Mesorhizobium sp. WSM4906]WFP74478.1 hypothetical protein QAZ22_22400 [Mesorhizobium sp. WSM4906]